MRTSTKAFVLVAVAVAVGLGTAISPFASASPDGLEKVAEDNGFLDEGTLGPGQESWPIPDYAFPGVRNERVATGLAGFAGTLIVFGLGYGLAALLRRRDGETARPGAPPARA